MDYLRKDCDNLLGKDRDLPLNKKQKTRKHFDDRDVCSFFLIDFCPHELFQNTKSDLGPCKKRHDNFYRAQFQTNPNREQYRLRYEEILEGFLERLISDVDTKIKRAIERIEAPLIENDNKSKYIFDQVAAIDKLIEEYALEAERLGEQGMIEQSEIVMKNIDQLRDQKNELLSLTGEHPLITKDKQLKICEICGALQSIQDDQKRLQVHYEGKLHTGYAKIREVLDQLKRKKIERRLYNENERERERAYRERVEEEKLLNLAEIENEINARDLGNYFDEQAFNRRLNELDKPIRGGKGRGRGRGGGDPNDNGRDGKHFGENGHREPKDNFEKLYAQYNRRFEAKDRHDRGDRNNNYGDHKRDFKHGGNDHRENRPRENNYHNSDVKHSYDHDKKRNESYNDKRKDYKESNYREKERERSRRRSKEKDKYDKYRK